MAAASWDKDELQTLDEYETYYDEMTTLVRSMKKNGPDHFDRTVPSKPKKDLMPLLGRVSKQKKKNEVLAGAKLHSYLKKHLFEDNVDTPRSFLKLGDEEDSLETLKPELKTGYDALKTASKKLLWHFIEYGRLLNVSAKLHEREKIRGTMEQTWKVWLQKNVGISDSYARQLRELSSVLISYPKFCHVPLPFLEMYKRRKEIKAMLEASTDIASFWSVPTSGEMS